MPRCDLSCSFRRGHKRGSIGPDAKKPVFQGATLNVQRLFSLGKEVVREVFQSRLLLVFDGAEFNEAAEGLIGP